ncbi:N-acetylglucosamine-6-phosphate deacetylase [Mitsuokella multacida]|uniref:N-acetylglucosamine-6-phosphate deacetylase n=1 Tax=Mitsuokella multacida TaxID=52226 RepID=UPI0022E3689F|nr:N-acetylglucosamine-6-phosphate deacetylase [Mitsuokella multacida]
MKAIINGRFIIPDETGRFTVEGGLALFFDEKIRAIRSAATVSAAEREELEACIDARGAYVSPGFLNVHIHGCVGADTMDDDPEAIRKMQLFQARTGVTAFLPTTMTYDFPTLGRAFRHVREAMAREEGARVLGCHMEGPFISPAKKGAQAEKNIAKADFAKIAPYQDIVKIITVAPEELPDGGQFIADCHAHGIVVSLGHTAADYATARQAIEEYGAKHITHLFNAMTGLHQRHPGVVGAALDTDANCELIVDNVHIHPAAQRIVYRLKKDHLILITDSLRACGLGDGPSELGGQKVFVKGTLATLEDGTIAGSVLCMNDGLRIFRENTGAPIEEVVTAVTKTPAKELGLYGELGSLSAGKNADITIFDDALKIQRTIVAGRDAYSA